MRQLLLQANINTVLFEGNRLTGEHSLSSSGQPVKKLQLKNNRYHPETGHWLINGQRSLSEADFLKKVT